MAASPASAEPPEYPRTPRDPVVDDYHGTRVADPWRWLEQLDSDDTRRWVNAQVRLTTGWLESATRRDVVRARLTSLSDDARVGVPWPEAGRLFWLERTGLEPQPALYVQGGDDAAATVVFDPNRLSPDGSTSMSDYVVSPGGRLLAYVAAEGGADATAIHVRDLATGRDVDDVVRGRSATWTRDERGFFYVASRARTPADVENGSPFVRQVFYHVLGEAPGKDRLVHQWQANTVWAYTMVSEDFRYVLLVAEEGTVSELHAIDLGDPGHPDVAAAPLPVLAGLGGFHTPVDVVGHTLFLRTNLDAPRGRVIAVNLRAGARAEPRTVVPESSGVLVDAVIAGRRLVVHYLADVQSRLSVFTLDGEHEGEIALPGIGAVGWPLSGRPSSRDLFYTFASFLSPDTVYRYEPETRRSVPFRPPRPRFEGDRYATRQVWFASKDGTRVPMFVTSTKDLELDGSHPVLLTGYGGYGATFEPEFRPDVLLWLELGGAYAVAGIRGGGELGAEWHRAGMLERKQASFDDFIAAAEYLVEERYTKPEKLAIYGHSNGGLLVGAVMTQRPELFAAAVANAGHHDMLRYHRFTAGAGWVGEYGSPDDPAAFPYLHAYSPLHNVREGTCYPATLLLAADHDDRVVPSHSYKFAAALQAAQDCDRPILLRVARNASHGYASQQEEIAERADLWAFVAAQLGVEVPARTGAERR